MCDITHLTIDTAERQISPTAKISTYVYPRTQSSQKLGHIGKHPLGLYLIHTDVFVSSAYPESWKTIRSRYNIQKVKTRYRYNWIINDVHIIIHELIANHEYLIIFTNGEYHYIIVCSWGHVTLGSHQILFVPYNTVHDMWRNAHKDQFQLTKETRCSYNIFDQ